MSLPSSATFAAFAQNSLYASVLATKSVSQLTSASAMVFLSAASARATMPCLDSLSTRWAATARPFSRRYLTASSMLPSEAASASLHEPMPAEVASRSCLIMSIVIVLSKIPFCDSCLRDSVSRPLSGRETGTPRLGLRLGGGGLGDGGLGLDDLGLALGGEIRLRLGLGGFLRLAGGGLHGRGDTGLLRRRGGLLLAVLRNGLRLALGTGGLLGRIALGALGLALAAVLGGRGAVLVVRALDDLHATLEDDLDAADAVVVAGNDVFDRLRVGVRVDDGDDGNVKTGRFLDGVGLADDVNDDERARKLGHLGDAGEVLLELVELAAEHRGLLLVLGELAAVGLRGRLELTHALDGGTEGLGVRERAAEPALGHVELVDGRRGVLDHLGDLLLGRDEEYLLAREDRVLEELGGLVEKRDGLRQVDDVASVALVEDVAFHLRIPALGLMAEVKAGIKQILERDARKGGRRHFHFVFSL